MNKIDFLEQTLIKLRQHRALTHCTIGVFLDPETPPPAVTLILKSTQKIRSKTLDMTINCWVDECSLKDLTHLENTVLNILQQDYALKITKQNPGEIHEKGGVHSALEITLFKGN